MKMIGIQTVLLISAAFAALTPTQAENVFANLKSGKADVVATEYGAVKGYGVNGVSSFLGVPYAAPPVGELRWKAPSAPSKWTAVRDAGHFGNSCVQTLTFGDFAERSTSEDCLYLNVFAPSKARNKLRPVMVWIHGGGLVNGRSNDYDGRKLVSDGNTVVVTLNYRLNVFGFLAHPALDSDGQASVSYGLMDQQFALQWVKRNIKAFGGDPDNVTLFGESAGGLSILFHLVSPPAAGLFHKAILQSGVSVAPQIPLEVGQKSGQTFASAAGCTDQTAACLRSLSVEQIIKAGPFTGTAMRVVDGKIMKQPVQQALAQGNFHKVPVLMGNNHDEYTWFVGLTELSTEKPLTPEEYPKTLNAAYGAEKGAKILAEYPLSNYASPSEALAAAQTSWFFVCPSFKAMRSLSKHVPVYAYEFMDRTAPYSFRSVSFPYNAAHTLDIQYLFPRFHGAQGTPRPLNAKQQNLSTDMISYWTNFAAKGHPNSKAAPAWLPYTAANKQLQLLDLPRPRSATEKDTGVDRKCAFWDQL